MPAGGDSDSTPLRPVRSYVLRQGRISRAQQRAHATLLPRYGVPFAPHHLNLQTLFGRAAPKILEIGSGMGETTARMAAQHPEQDYLAVEVHTPGVGSLLKRIEEASLANVRIIQHDAVEVLRAMIPPGSLDAVHIFFPDPWPKKRHHKRRLLQAPVVDLIAAGMKPGAYLHIATDWDDYARHILDVLAAHPGLVNTASDYAPRPPHRPLTKFEERGVKLGHAVRDIVFRRR
jgi:tRNA (guanine-N7-)-methyltransferase